MKLLSLINKFFKAPTDKGVIKTSGGRTIYRHPNNCGSVIEFDYWGSPKQLFIADAKYRAAKEFDSIPRNHNLHNVSVNSSFFNDAGSHDFPDRGLLFTRSDEWIQQEFKDLKNDGTAELNTNALMKYKTTHAAHHCRSVKVPDVGACDLPNLYELIVIYLESDLIDKLDPTADQFPNLNVGSKNPYGRFNLNYKFAVISSTENAKFDLFSVFQVRSFGFAYRNNQNKSFGVVPVKELN